MVLAYPLGIIRMFEFQNHVSARLQDRHRQIPHLLVVLRDQDRFLPPHRRLLHR